MPLGSKAKKFSKLPRERRAKEAFVESEYSAEYQADLITPDVQQAARNPQALRQNNILQLQRLIGNKCVEKKIAVHVNATGLVS